MGVADWIIVVSATLAALIDIVLWVYGDKRDSAGLRAALWAFCCVVLVVTP